MKPANTQVLKPLQDPLEHLLPAALYAELVVQTGYVLEFVQSFILFIAMH